MSVVATRLRSLARYATVMQSPADVYRYARLRLDYARGTPARAAVIRLRALGGAGVICRPSQDVHTLRHTFFMRYHLPPVPLPPDATIVDLGSNVGYTVADLAHRYPRARIVGVEMDRTNFELAHRNTAHYGERVTLVHAAAWTLDGVVRYGGVADDAFRVDGHGGAGGDQEGELTAPAKRVSTILDESGLDEVDYMKIDIEGAEGAILADAAPWAERVRSMKIEVHAPVTTTSCRRTLEPLGFDCWEDEVHPACLCAVRR